MNSDFIHFSDTAVREKQNPGNGDARGCETSERKIQSLVPEVKRRRRYVIFSFLLVMATVFDASKAYCQYDWAGYFINQLFWNGCPNPDRQLNIFADNITPTSATLRGFFRAQAFPECGNHVDAVDGGFYWTVDYNTIQRRDGDTYYLLINNSRNYGTVAGTTGKILWFAGGLRNFGWQSMDVGLRPGNTYYYCGWRAWSFAGDWQGISSTKEFTAPVNVTSVVAQSSPLNNNYSSVQFRVTFDGPVKGLTASNFSLVTSAGAAGAFVTGTPTIYGSGIGDGTSREWLVQVNTSAVTTGTIRLSVGSGNNIINNAGRTVGIYNEGFVSSDTYTVDRVAPLAPVFTGVNPDTGNPGDNITANTNPVLNGTAEANSKVTVNDNGVTTVITVSAAGAWQYSLPNRSNGTYTLTATAADAVGNVSPAGTFSYRIKTTPPSSPGVITSIVNDTGVSSTDRITNDNTLTFTGTAEAGGIVSVFINTNTTAAGTANADASGNWTYTTPALGSGPYYFSTMVTDGAGNSSSRSVATATWTIDGTAPVISGISVLSSNVLPATRAKVGDKITLTYTSSEQVSSVVTIAGRAVTATNTGNNWKAEYVLTAGDTEGLVAYTISVTDVAGNVVASPVSTNSTILFDRTNPALSALQVISSNSNPARAKKGDKITVSYTSSEAVSSVVSIAGHSVSATSAGNNWTAEYILQDSDTEALIPYTISLTDLAGNVMSPAISANSSILFDRTAPTISAVQIAGSNSNPARAKVGDRIVLTYTSSETVSSSVSIAGRSVTATNTGNSWTAEYVMTGADTEGLIPYTISITDPAGNTVISPVSANSTITFDRTAPAVSAVVITSSNSNPLRGRTGDVLTLAYTSSETVNSLVSIAGHVITATNTGNNWTAQYTLTDADTEGPVPYTISVTDRAGNTIASPVSVNSTIVFDKTAPLLSMMQIVSSNGNAVMAKTGDKITLTYRASEAVSSTVTIAGNTVTANAAGNNWTAEYILRNTDAEGLIPYTVSVKDLAGNAVLAPVAENSTITFDRTSPVISLLMVESSNGNTSQAKTGDKITITYVTSELVTSLVNIRGHVVTANRTGNNWIAEYILTNTDTEGPIPYSVTVTDPAANAVTESNSGFINFDRTNPQIRNLSFTTSNSNSVLAEVGNTVTLQFDTDETVIQPEIKISGHIIVASNMGGNTWKAQYVMAAGDTEGKIPYVVKVTDPAGNATPLSAESDVVFKTAPVFTWQLPAKTYGDAAFTTTAATSHNETVIKYSSSNPVVATIDENSGQVSIHQAGVTEIAALQPESAHFLNHRETRLLTVNKAALSAQINAAEKIYGTANPSFSAGYSGFVNGENENVIDRKGVVNTVNPVDQNTPAGIYGLYFATTPEDINYYFTLNQSAVLTIRKAAASITFNSLTPKMYGDSDFAPGATSNHTESPVTYSSSNPAVATIVNNQIHITGAGTTVITASQEGTANYLRATDITSTLTVNKAPLMITAVDKTKIFGQANPQFSFTYSGFKYADTYNSLRTLPAASTPAVWNSAVNVYPINVAGAASDNYVISYTAGRLHIGKKDLVVTADNQSKKYGEDNPAFTVNYSGFIDGEDRNFLNSEPIASTAATSDTPVGDYPVIVSGGASLNYNFIYQSGNLSIGKNASAIAINPLPAGKLYGDAGFTITAFGNHSETPITYSSGNQSVATVDADGFVHITGAGTTTILVSQAASTNYSAPASISRVLTIGKAPLSISVAPSSKKYGEDNPEFLISYNGFVKNENEAHLISLPVANTTAERYSAAGEYPVTLDQASSANYEISYVNSKLTVLRNEAIVNFAGLPVKTYGDANFSAGARSNHSESALVYSSSNTSVATIDQNGTIHITGAGTTLIKTAQGASSNYEAATEISQTLTVNKKALRITVENKSKRYLEDNPLLTAIYTGFVNNEHENVLTVPVSLSTTADKNSVTGEYPIHAERAEAANYAISYTDGIFIINPEQSNITFNTLPVKVFGDSDFFSGALSVHNETPVTYISSNPQAAIVTADGTVHITGAGQTVITASQAASTNYAAARNMSQALTIMKGSPEIIVSEVSFKTYGDADFSVQGASINRETAITYVSSKPSVATISSEGLVHIAGAGVTTVTLTQAGSSNYEDATPVSWNLFVEKKAAEISFAELPVKTFGDPDFSGNAASNHNESPIVYKSSSSAIATIASNLISIKGTGQVLITAQQAESANYLAASVQRVLTVTKAVPVIDFAALPQKINGDPGFMAQAVSNNREAPILFRSNNTAIATVEGKTIYAIGSGRVNITASQSETANYLATSVDQLLTVIPKVSDKPVIVNPDSPQDTAATPGRDSIIVNLKNSVINGKGEPGSTVIIYIDGVEVGRTLIDELGNWSYTLNVDITEGRHELTIKIINKDGIESEISQPIIVDVDLTPPPPATNVGTSGPGGESNGTINTNTPTPVLNGKAEPGATVDIYVDGETTPRGTGVADENGNWQITLNPPLSEGEHTIKIVVTDKAGNSTESPVPTVTVDTKKPQVPVVTDVNGNPSDNSGTVDVDTHQPVIGGNAEPGSVIEIWIDGKKAAEVTVGADGKWEYTFDPALADGAYQVVIIGRDPAGNNSETNVNLEIVVVTTRAKTVISFPSLPEMTYGAADFPARVRTNSKARFKYTTSDINVATINANGIIHITGAGRTIITAAQDSVPGFTEDSASVELIVNKSAQTISFASVPVLKRFGPEYNLTVSTSSGLPLEITSNNQLVAKVSGKQLQPQGIGNTVIHVRQAGNKNYLPAETEININVIDADGAEVIVSNLVSPNGDGINDLLMIEGLSNATSHHLVVVNRNGTKVFDTKNYDTGDADLKDGKSWGGIAPKMFKGVATAYQMDFLPGGTYFYVVRYTINGVAKQKTGYFVLRH